MTLRSAHRALAQHLRSFTTAAASPTVTVHGTHVLSAAPQGLVEIRQYTLHPAGAKKYLKLTGDFVEGRKQRTPFLGMFTCDTGSTLNRITHFYQYNDFDERDATRAAMLKDSDWQRDYIDAGRPWLANQESRIMRHAVEVHEAAGVGSAASFESPQRAEPGSPPAVYEMRSYQLHPGYGNVPAVLKAFKSGLPAKMAADRAGRLVFFGFTEVGVLNNLVELWRYPSAQASVRAREAARGVTEWRDTVAAVTPLVQNFETATLHATPFSPWQ